jgi:PAS domain S-box-containing protein
MYIKRYNFVRVVFIEPTLQKYRTFRRRPGPVPGGACAPGHCCHPSGNRDLEIWKIREVERHSLRSRYWPVHPVVFLFTTHPRCPRAAGGYWLPVDRCRIVEAKQELIFCSQIIDYPLPYFAGSQRFFMDSRPKHDDELELPQFSLPARDELYRTLARNFPNGAVLLFDRHLRYILADGAGLSEVGLSSRMLEGKTIWDVFPAEVCQVLEPRYRAALAGEMVKFEIPYGGRIYQVHTVPIRDERGKVSTGMVMTQDITDRKRAEERLASSQQRYEQLVHSIDGIVWEGNAQTFEYYFVSKQAERLLGYPVERWTSEPDFWRDHIHPDDRDWALNYCALSTAQKKDHVFEYRMVAADGRLVWLRDIVTVVVENDQPVTLRGVMVDITENKRVEADLHEREQQYRSIFESVSDGLFINSLEDGHLVDFNPAAARMHGYSVEEFRHLQPIDFIHPDSLPSLQDYIETVRSGGVFRDRALDVRKDGSTFFVEVLGTSFIYKGKPHALGVVRDIDEEVKSYQLLEQRVEERTRELQTLLDVSRNVASTLDLDQLISLIIEQLKSIVDFTALRVWILEDEDTFVIKDFRGPMPAEKNTLSWKQPPRHRAIVDLVNRLEPFIIPDVKADKPAALMWREATSEMLGEVPDIISCFMVVPLVVNNQVIGLLSFNHQQPNFYTQRHAELALALANHAAVAIENARLYKNSQELAALQERQKLARELHDSVSQALYGIGLGARAARKLLDLETTQSEDLVQPLEYVLSLAEAGLAEMRALIFELRPDSLENEGLIAALSKQAAALEARHQIPVEADLGQEPDLALEAKEALYRIAQEAMHNIVKHANASRVVLRLGVDADYASLEIQDDGSGFDPQGNFPGHLGLRSMRERAERLGGQLIIESLPGRGTRLNARMPV